MHFAKTRPVVASLVGAILCSMDADASAQEPLKLAGSQLEPVKWTELAGWPTDDHLAACLQFLAIGDATLDRDVDDDQSLLVGAAIIATLLPSHMANGPNGIEFG